MQLILDVGTRRHTGVCLRETYYIAVVIHTSERLQSASSPLTFLAVHSLVVTIMHESIHLHHVEL